MSERIPYLGFGLGLRPPYYEQILNTAPPIDWFEITTENYFIPGGRPLYYLDKIKERYPVIMHGVSLSLGSSDPLDKTYLNDLKTLASRVNPVLISDHLCFTGVNGVNLHDLLPMPYTTEAIQHISSRIMQVQDFLKRRIAVENVSSYISYTDSEMPEWVFINDILKAADCYLLLDINNVYVSAKNHQFCPYTYLDKIDPHRVVQIHLAGHTDCGTYIIDTHDAEIIDPVWALYTYYLKKNPDISTMIERDDHFEPLETLIQELEKARHIRHQLLQEVVIE